MYGEIFNGRYCDDKNTYQLDALQVTQHNKYEMLQVRFDWACSWAVLKCATPLTPPSTSLSRNLTFYEIEKY